LVERLRNARSKFYRATSFRWLFSLLGSPIHGYLVRLATRTKRSKIAMRLRIP
jgi:hypothetical protein